MQSVQLVRRVIQVYNHLVHGFYFFFIPYWPIPNPKTHTKTHTYTNFSFYKYPRRLSYSIRHTYNTTLQFHTHKHTQYVIIVWILLVSLNGVVLCMRNGKEGRFNLLTEDREHRWSKCTFASSLIRALYTSVITPLIIPPFVSTSLFFYHLLFHFHVYVLYGVDTYLRLHANFCVFV